MEIVCSFFGDGDSSGSGDKPAASRARVRVARQCLRCRRCRWRPEINMVVRVEDARDGSGRGPRRRAELASRGREAARRDANMTPPEAALLLIMLLAALSMGRPEHAETRLAIAGSSPATSRASSPTTVPPTLLLSAETEDQSRTNSTTEETSARVDVDESTNRTFEYAPFPPSEEHNSVEEKTANASAADETTPSSVSSTTPYSLLSGPLQCDEAAALSVKKSQGRCTYVARAGSDLPDVLCEQIAGRDRVKETFATLVYTAATYSVVQGWESAGSLDATRDGHPCVHQTRWETRRVERQPEGLEVEEEDSTLSVLKHDREGQNTIMSQGVKAIVLDLRPGAVGPKGALYSDYACAFNSSYNHSTCNPDIRIIPYLKDPSLIKLFINRSWRIFMEFNPAYIKVASYILDFLGDALLEELVVHGGENWGDPPRLTPRLPRMKLVDLSGTGLTNLRPEIFVNLPHLQVLKLARNNFSTIPEGINSLRDLLTLDMSANPLTSPAMYQSLQPLSLLQFLNLSFSSLQGFESLVPRTEDDGKYFLGSKLELLDLTSCSISHINTSAAVRFFKLNANLRVVHLSGNPLRTIPPELFRPLRALQQLHLAHANLASPLHLRLAAAARLLALDLSANNLTTPSGIVTEGSVDVLDISSNLLRPWTDSQAFASIRALNLSRVALSTFSPAMLESLRNLQWVDLGWNPIDCDSCDLPLLQSWLEDVAKKGTPALFRLAQPVRDLECVHPSSKRFTQVRKAPAPPSDRCSNAALVWTLVVCGMAVIGAVALLVFRFRLELTYVAHVMRANRSVRAATAPSHMDTPSAYEFDAFVCYSKYDRAWVIGELLPRLEGGEHKYRLCLHERDFPLGSLILQNIVECMHRSRHTIIVLTRAFVESQWCQWELEMATHRLLEGGSGGGRDFLILVELERLEARALPRLLRMLVETRTFLEWPPPGAPTARAQQAWKRLCGALGPPLRPALEATPPEAAPKPIEAPSANGEVIAALNVSGEETPESEVVKCTPNGVANGVANPTPNGFAPHNPSPREDAKCRVSKKADEVWFTAESNNIG